MTVTSLMEGVKFGNGDGIEYLIKYGVGPLREFAGMVADYAEASLDNDLRLWMIKDLTLDQIDELEKVLNQFMSEAKEAAGE